MDSLGMETAMTFQERKIFEAGGSCPCRNCTGVFERERFTHGDYEDEADAYVLCADCGYCPEEEFDPVIRSCPICKSYCHIINQDNIICSGCGLEFHGRDGADEWEVIRLWNSIPRHSWLPFIIIMLLSAMLLALSVLTFINEVRCSADQVPACEIAR